MKKIPPKVLDKFEAIVNSRKFNNALYQRYKDEYNEFMKN